MAFKISSTGKFNLSILIYLFYALLFGLVILLYLPAPTYFFWKLALGLISWAHLIALLVLVISILYSVISKQLSWAVAGGILCAMFIFPAGKIYFSKDFTLKQWPIIPLTISPAKIIYDAENQLDAMIYINQKAKNKLPLIVTVHGGAWSSGSSGDFHDFNMWLASKGYVVADVNYRLAPQYTFPTPVKDIENALLYLLNNADTFAIDTSQIYLLGRSAGGQIAATVACKLGMPTIKGVICFYTPFDLEWGYSFPGNPLILDSRKVLVDYMGGTPEQKPENYHSASTVNLISATTPPFLLLHGDRDEMVAYAHNLRLINALNKFQVPNTFITVPFGTHGFDYFFNSPTAQMANLQVLRFLQTHTQTTF